MYTQSQWVNTPNVNFTQPKSQSDVSGMRARVGKLGDCRDCYDPNALSDGILDTLKSGFNQLVGNTGDSINKAATQAASVAQKTDNFMTAVEKYKYAFISVGVLLVSVWATDLFLNIQEIRKSI